MHYKDEAVRKPCVDVYRFSFCFSEQIITKLSHFNCAGLSNIEN